jgi:hypothetical protein
MALVNPYRLTIGPYWLLVPEEAKISAEVKMPAPGAFRSAPTYWTISMERFWMSVSLDPLQDLSQLKKYIDYSTQSSVATKTLVVNGLQGVTYGGYMPRTWIDWHFKKGDTMICLNLQARGSEGIQPTTGEELTHRAIVESLKYCRDHAEENPPAG